MDVLLVSFGVAVLALTSVLMNLDMEMDPKTNDYKALTELLPLGLVLVQSTKEAETLSKQMDALIAFRIKALALQEALFDSTSSDDDDDPLDVLDHVELHNTLGTPYSIIRSFVNSTDQQKQVTLNRDTLKRVETKLNKAFIQFYHKIGLLKSYR
ncbi:hypothetical protein LWI28_016842 [Acer negundo]|uniref:SPX domain-containing protein n=1 Tax=Acer negundo TaxID=4023 RepID=A0AAD5NJW5_ACENE|nr:hypothetical protein LWI28_016842 [Acer negundo]